jgi:N-acetylmuramoyl-L-alanine amidase
MTPPSARRHVDRLKRTMLRDAVAENLATIEGLVPRRGQRVPRSSWLWWIPVTVVALGILVGTLKPTAAGRGKPLPDETVATGLAVRQDAERAQPEQLPLLSAPRAVNPATFRLAVRRVVVDPGHGGNDPGAMTRGMREKDLTLDIARRLNAALRAAGFEVVMTREADETVSLHQRVEAANDAHGDLLLSIHVNSIPTPVRRGVETYVLGTTSDPRVEKLAGAENSGSGYSLADFRRLLEGVLLDVRHDESRRFAQMVQNHMFATLRRSNPELEDRSVKQAPFVVLVGTEMPGVLAEVSCLSNPEDTLLLKDGNYRQTIAEALAAGVRDYAASRERATAVARRGPGAM